MSFPIRHTIRRIAQVRRQRVTSNTYTYRCLSTNSAVFRVSEEIRQAIAEKRPVVALESTIYTHGWAYPDNIALASQLQSIVRSNGGVPATVGVLDGVARVGLDAEEIIRLAGSAGKPETLKISRRDLGFACGLGSPGRKANGGTTVAGTMILAHLAGIKVFATGGLGGVHRGAQDSMDISADLTELGRTPVAVISSGCKSFLDIPRTLEYLETQGVPVATFADGRSGQVDFPAFWSRDSGIPSPVTVRDEIEAAAVIYAQNSLGIRSGLHFANPIPAEFSIPKDTMDEAINTAIEEAARAGKIGAANTPFILAKIKELTASSSVTANRALIESNVQRGVTVAKELQKLETSAISATAPQTEPSHFVVGPGSSNYTSSGLSRGVSNPTKASTKPEDQDPVAQVKAADNLEAPRIFVAGSLAVDLSCDYAPKTAGSSKEPVQHTSNPASIGQSLGGVGHNVARAASLMGAAVRLCSAVGSDLSGKAALEALKQEDMDDTGIKIRDGARTAQYVAVNNVDKDLYLAMADMGILEDHDKHESVIPGETSAQSVADTFDNFWLSQLQSAKPSHVVLDANWQPDMLARWLQAFKTTSSHVSFEPVSTAKSAGIFHLPPSNTLTTFPNHLIDLTAPNTFELTAMYTEARAQGFFERQDWWQAIDALGIPSTGARTQMAYATSPALVDAGVPQQSIQLLPFIPCVIAKLGSAGVLLTQILRAGDERLSSGEYAPYILSRCNNGTEDTLGVGGVYMRLFPAVEEVDEREIISVNGVGDTFLGTIVAGLEKRGKGAKVEDLVDIAQRAAVLTLKSKEAVSPDLSSLRSLL